MKHQSTNQPGALAATVRALLPVIGASPRPPRVSFSTGRMRVGDRWHEAARLSREAGATLYDAAMLDDGRVLYAVNCRRIEALPRTRAAAELEHAFMGLRCDLRRYLDARPLSFDRADAELTIRAAIEEGNA